jgi:hypothetical protein
MLGEYLTALLVAVLGYIYPVYLCFKARRDRSSRVWRPSDFSPRTVGCAAPRYPSLR